MSTGRDSSERPAGWDASWSATERAQLETMSAATPAQQLAWLEEAMQIAHRCGALEARRVSSETG